MAHDDEQRRVFGRRHEGRWRRVHWPAGMQGGRLERVGRPGVWREATYPGLGPDDDVRGEGGA